VPQAERAKHEKSAKSSLKNINNKKQNICSTAYKKYTNYTT